MFTCRDLDELDRLILSPAAAVVAMRDIHAGERDPNVIGLRHDVDDNRGSLDTATRIAGWEAAHGYRSTYFILHTAAYWRDEPRLRAALEQIAGHGHEIGIHCNAITAALEHGGDPHQILHAAIEQLRGYGYPVTGVVGHGDRLCRIAGFVNDEQFLECGRPQMGAPDRELAHAGRRLQLDPRPLAEFGLEYVSIWLPHDRYLSDSGGTWNLPPSSVPDGPGQLHVLQHPDWWGAAFAEGTSR